jgi:hypothetical protein
LLLPDPRPLVERLGADFFRQAPSSPGVYLMRDESDAVLYVGKAKSLRNRLASYRVANPERLPRRQLRLLRAVRRIELQLCPDEGSALAREAELLRSLRPRFNRAGTWPGPDRSLAWRRTETGLELAVTSALAEGWSGYGPLGAGAFPLRAVLARLLWCALQPERGLAGLPQGWFHGGISESFCIPRLNGQDTRPGQALACVAPVFGGNAGPLCAWVRECTTKQNHPFERSVREADLEAISEFASRQSER